MCLIFINRCMHLLLQVRLFLGGHDFVWSGFVNIATADGREKFASKI
jgi:hypothetical protein